jgi:nitrogen fixation NifU-like protein
LKGVLFMPKDDMLGPYSEKVMEHFMNPRNMGEIKDADAVGTVGNPACGDVMRLYLKVSDDKILDAKFKTFGCGAAIATSSMATEMIKGKTVDESLKITNEAVAEALDGLPANKMHCSVLAQEAIEAAINNYKEKSAKKQTSDEK